MAEDNGYHKRLQVRQKVEDMIDFASPFLRQFPRVERLLAKTIEMEMYNLLRLCVTAESGYKFKTTVQEIDVSQKAIQCYIRVAKVRKILPMKHYESWSEYLTNIGQMVGGLLKAVSQPTQHRG